MLTRQKVQSYPPFQFDCEVHSQNIHFICYYFMCTIKIVWSLKHYTPCKDTEIMSLDTLVREGPSFTDTFTGIALKGVSGPPEAQIIHTLSKFQYLINKLYPTTKLSFIPKMCHLWNNLPSSFSESYNLPSFKSAIDRIDLLNLSF